MSAVADITDHCGQARKAAQVLEQVNREKQELCQSLAAEKRRAFGSSGQARLISLARRVQILVHCL